jgi:signal peptide peptidase SppA
MPSRPSPPPAAPPPRRHGFWAVLCGIGRGINVVRLLIINAVFFFLLLIVLLLVVGGIAGSRATRTVADGSVLVLQPEGQLVEQYSIDPLQRAVARLSGNKPEQVQLRDLVGAIDAAARDKRISRILLLPGELHAGGFAALREVGAALDRFRAAGKPVIAWAANLDQGQYYLAAHADRVLLDPQGSLMLTGLANYRLFYKDLLDKLGVDVHLFRVGQFKSAAEPYILDHASPAAKEADSYWMGGLWDEYLAEVAKLRKLDPAALRADVDDLPQTIASTQGDLARLALDEHLIDGTATRAQLIAMLRGQGVPAAKNGHGFRAVDLAHYVADLPDSANLFAPGVTVVVAEGDVAASGGYWISMNADRIVAEPNTITGSIGIFGMYYTVPNTLAKLGISSDGVATGPMAGAFDITRPLDPKVGAVIQAIIDKGYRDFVGGVAKARGKSFADIDTIAQGRVWTGRQALDRGLVDQLGGLGDAVSDAAALARLGKDYPVRYQQAPLGTFERFLVGFSQNAGVELLQSWGVRLPPWFAQIHALAPELSLLRDARAGVPNVYAYCFCSPH